MCDGYGETQKYTAVGWVRLPVKFDIYARSYDEACERADTLANSKKTAVGGICRYSCFGC